MELPHTIGECANYIFAVIGAKEAGKSHYLAVLIEQILHHVGPALGMLLEPQGDHTIKRYRLSFYDPLYRQKRVIAGTKSALADVSVRMPLVYSLTFTDRDFAGRTKIRRAVSLVFFDTAGEDLDSSDTMATANKYIYRSDGIILLLDPLQLDRVRDQLAASTPLPAQNSETADIVTRTTDLIRNGRHLDHRSVIDTPLAVAFSKFDAVSPLVDRQCQIHQSADHRGGFDKADADAVSGEMESFVSQWQGEALLNQVHTRFRHHAFFGLSALGCNPHGDSSVPVVLPHRVEDPFLWLLNHHGLLKTAKPSR